MIAGIRAGGPRGERLWQIFRRRGWRREHSRTRGKRSQDGARQRAGKGERGRRTRDLGAEILGPAWQRMVVPDGVADHVELLRSMLDGIMPCRDDTPGVDLERIPISLRRFDQTEILHYTRPFLAKGVSINLN